MTTKNPPHTNMKKMRSYNKLILAAVIIIVIVGLALTSHAKGICC
jgi:hypothetical protein